MRESKEYRERADEVGLNLTVMSNADEGYGPCPVCGAKSVVFHCHLFREGKVEDRCKECAIKRAGGESAVYVKAGASFTWKTGRWDTERTAAATAARKARSNVKTVLQPAETAPKAFVHPR
jgi:predicted RNA-binding Zn-ribbon protein involved in translation (DUF1610 family)